MRTRMFYGWWMVLACMIASLVGNALGLFGVGVYLHAIIAANGWTIGAVSGSATLFYMVSAVLLIPVGAGIGRFGPRPVIALGGVSIAAGVAGIGHASALWQVYLAFPLMGVGWACLSTTAIATTLAPWFERYQGRATSIASLGASAGGMLGAPALLFGIGQVGFGPTTLIAGGLAVIILLPLAGFVLRHRPRDIGLLADGLPADGKIVAAPAVNWSRVAALRTRASRSVMVTFGIGMMVQIGFLTHQVTVLAQSLSTASVSLTVSATAIAALAGRLALARFADQIDVRLTAAAVLLLAAAAFAVMALVPVPVALIGGSIVFGLTVGNVTTLSPIIVRQEFGAPAFGVVLGVASCGVQQVTGLGPSFYGALHDALGGYRVPLMIAAWLDIVAAAVIVVGRAPPVRASVG